MVEEGARTDSASEPFSLSKANDEGTEDVLKLLVRQIVANVCERFRGLLTYHSLVRLSQRLQQLQERCFVRIQLPYIAKLLSNGKQDFVVLVLNQRY